MRIFCFLSLLLLLTFIGKSQTATFITISSGGQFDRVTIGATGCTSTTLNLCNNFTGSPLSIALDGNILYVVDNKGFLHKNILTNTGTVGNCTNLGQFVSKSTATYGLTVGNGGIVYAASGSNIEFYNPVANAFGIVGTLPNNWKIGGDLLFYKGILYEAVTVSGGGNALIQVDIVNPSNSTLYMNFNSGTNVFGFASVTVPCKYNQSYALSTTGSSTEIYAVDFTNKTQAATAFCTLPFKVNDAASIAETQSTSPPSSPIFTSPFNICQGDAVNFTKPTVGSVKDTLRWYTQAVGGISYGSPTPAISAAILGNTNYYVSSFDTSTGCESARNTIDISVNPYPAVPTINPSDSIQICTGSNISLASSAANDNQWNLNGGGVTGATNTIYTTSIAGNYTVTTATDKGCAKTSLPIKIIVTDTLKSTTNIATCTAFFPYTWNGLTFNGAGTQTKFGFKTSSGCDSTATLVLSVSDTIKSTTTKSICANALPYTWNGMVFNSAATKVYYAISNASCDSAITLVLKVDTAATVTNKIYDCKKIIYQGTTYTNSTIVRDTVRSVGGCDSIYNEIYIVITPLNIVTNTINLSNCKQVLYKGNIYSSTTTVRDTLKSYQGCDSIYNVANISIIPIAKTTRTINLKHCSRIIYNGITYTTTTSLKDTLRNASGCDSIYNTVNITIAPITPTILTTYFSSCDSVVYLGTTYYNPISIIDTAKSIGGCDSIYKQVVINIFAKSTVSFNNSTVYTLENTPIVLKPITTNADLYEWTPAIFLDDATTQYPVCTPLKDTTYKLKVTSDSGCIDVDYVRVMVSKTISIPNVFSPNGDGINDKWDIPFLNTYPQNTVQIFNRAGQLLYSSFAGSFKAWNGQYNGKDLPVGVYYFIVKLASTLPVQSGAITILR